MVLPIQHSLGEHFDFTCAARGLATKPCQIRLADQGFDHIDGLHQRLIARCVAILIVHSFEIIKVNQHQAGRITCRSATHSRQPLP